MSRAVEIHVTGGVQGVSYRAYAAHVETVDVTDVAPRSSTSFEVDY